MSENESDLSPNTGRGTYSLPQRRRAALQQIDEASFNRFHIKVCLVAGVGFFTDAYDLFAINIASTMIGNVYGDSLSDSGRMLNKIQEVGLKVASPIGTLCGQVFFGWLADRIGRKRAYGIELIIIINATVVQALSGQGHAVGIVGVLALWRFVMGIGIGGDYPLSAVISSEFASTRIRGRMMTAVIAAQGWGQFSAAVVGIVVVTAYKNQILNSLDLSDPSTVDSCWRLIIGLGAIPAALALYFRLTIPETPRFTMDIEMNVHQASKDIHSFFTDGTFGIDHEKVVQRAQGPRASRRDFINYFGQWQNGKVLLGTAFSWFAIDVAFYGIGLNNSPFLNNIKFVKLPSTAHPQSGVTIYQNLINLCIGNTILSVAGLIPGYYATMLLIDSVGRKRIQLMGFIVLTILFIIMGSAYGTISKHNGAFISLYCIVNFFQNFGPNVTTFIVPGEAFPTRYRSTAYGISAASGKLGAIIGQFAFTFSNRTSINPALLISAFFMFIGIFSTLLIPETKGRSLEDISNENQDTFLRDVPYQ